MISPLRRKKADRSVTPDPQVLMINTKSMKSGKEVYARKNLNEKVNLLKSTLQDYIQNGKSAKEKGHVMLVEMKPILKYTE